ETGKQSKPYLGKADAGGVVARGDAPVAGERQLQAAAEAEAMDTGDDRDRQTVQAVEIAVDLGGAVDHLAVVGGLIGMAYVGADDEALLLAGDENEPADCLLTRSLLGALDDHGELLKRPPAQGVLALALAVEHRPGDALMVDREAPIPQRVHVKHGWPHS